VPKQQISLTTQGHWSGDLLTSGILGMGLPGLTDAYVGEVTGPSDPRNVVPYLPLVSTVANQLSNGIFSLALHRTHSQSFLSWGGVPPDVKTTGEWATTPLKKLQLRDGTSEYLYYQIAVDKMSWTSTNDSYSGVDSKPPEYIVDSGTTLNYLPAGALTAPLPTSLLPPHALFSRC
jgi:hypothetical protein